MKALLVARKQAQQTVKPMRAGSYVSRRCPSIIVVVLWATCCFAAWGEPGRDWVQTTASAPWSPRAGHTAVAYRGKVWVIGGASYSGGFFADVWWTTDGAHWTAAVPPPGSRATNRAGHTSIVYSDKMWLIGGNSADPGSNVYFSTNGTTWTRATANAPWTRRINHGSVVFGGKMWVIAGFATPQGPDLNDIWYSTNGTSWTCATAHAQFSPRGVAICLVYDGRIWLIGGSGGLMKDVWCSSNGTTWTRVLAEGPWRGYLASGVVGGEKMWVMGGTAAEWWDAFSVSDVWCSKDGIHWTQVTPQAAWVGREDFPIVVHNRRMWILGGDRMTSVYDPLIFLNDVWYSEIPTDARPSWKLYP